MFILRRHFWFSFLSWLELPSIRSTACQMMPRRPGRCRGWCACCAPSLPRQVLNLTWETLGWKITTSDGFCGRFLSKKLARWGCFKRCCSRWCPQSSNVFNRCCTGKALSISWHLQRQIGQTKYTPIFGGHRTWGSKSTIIFRKSTRISKKSRNSIRTRNQFFLLKNNHFGSRLWPTSNLPARQWDCFVQPFASYPLNFTVLISRRKFHSYFS